MKIIERGINPSEQPVKKTCYKCKSKLEYTHEDIHIDFRDGNYIICPVCKTPISVGYQQEQTNRSTDC